MEFIQSILGDEFLSKAFVLSVLTGFMVYMKNVPTYIWTKLKRHIVFSVTIEQTDELFDYVERWLLANYEKKYRNILAYIKYRNFAMNNDVKPDNNDSIEKVNYRHNQDTIIIKRNGVIMRVGKGREKLENARTFQDLYFDKYFITTMFFKKRILLLLDEIVEYNQQFRKKENGVGIYTISGYSEWKRERIVTPKKVDDIILDKTTKDLILNDVDLYSKSKDWYLKRHIPYKRGYLFYGSAGNGKTSMALALAQYLNRDLYVFMIPMIRNDNALKNLFDDLGDNAILLIEDVDSIFNNRKTEEKVSFSALLNCLDGVYYKESVITIMTTNHKEKLDYALIRDGRVDLRIEFKNPQEKQVKEYVELFYETKINGVSYKDGGYSMSAIQNHCLNKTEEEIKNLLFQPPSK